MTVRAILAEFWVSLERETGVIPTRIELPAAAYDKLVEEFGPVAKAGVAAAHLDRGIAPHIKLNAPSGTITVTRTEPVCTCHYQTIGNALTSRQVLDTSTCLLRPLAAFAPPTWICEKVEERWSMTDSAGRRWELSRTPPKGNWTATNDGKPVYFPPGKRPKYWTDLRNAKADVARYTVTMAFSSRGTILCTHDTKD